jgi:hypothetical protein
MACATESLKLGMSAHSMGVLSPCNQRAILIKKNTEGVRKEEKVGRHLLHTPMQIRSQVWHGCLRVKMVCSELFFECTRERDAACDDGRLGIPPVTFRVLG